MGITNINHKKICIDFFFVIINSNYYKNNNLGKICPYNGLEHYISSFITLENFVWFCHLKWPLTKNIAS